jgi:signal transduction histidine kinase
MLRARQHARKPMARRSGREISRDLKQLAKRSTGNRERRSLLHEVHVYQEELTVQNEALTRAQIALEETRDRLIELYDFAPIGYLTLDPNGLVLQINLTGAAFIGKPRQAIEGMPLLGLIATDNRARFLDFLRQCRVLLQQQHERDLKPDIITEVAMRCADGRKDVQILCRARQNMPGKAEFFATLMDITEPKRLEAAHAKAAKEHAELARRLLSVQDEERQRIARDLHDNVGQQITSLRLMLDVMSMAPLDNGLRARVARSLSIVEELDRHLDFITSGLRPASLDLGMTAAIEQFVGEWSSTLGIASDFSSVGMDDGFRFAADVEIHLYRVTQEALNNIAKHADATRVSVSLERMDSAVVLTISDDGRGFKAESDQISGLGLVGMRERAQIVRGSIDVHSAPGEGTTVSLRVPVGRAPR